MTDIVEPPLIDELPEAPQPSDSPEEFEAKSYAMVAAQVAMVPQINASNAAAQQNAMFAAQQAVVATREASAAVAAAASASEVQAALWGATNFKGIWGGLVGALSKPATVKHEGRFWLLLRNVVDVATQEPGVSDAWTSLDAGERVQQEVGAGTIACIPGVLYVITGAAVTLTAPVAGLQPGDYFGFRLAAPVSGTQVIDFGAVKVRGQAAGQRHIDQPGFGLDLQFNANGGWV